MAKGGITFTMLWDRAGGSWRALGIPIQPAAILYGPDGAELGRWQGLMDEEEILDLVGG